MHLVSGHPGTQFNDTLESHQLICAHMYWTQLKRGQLSTDHHLVENSIGWQGKMPDSSSRPKRIVRVCRERLDEDPVKMVFNAHLQESFDHILGWRGIWTLNGPCCTLQLSRLLCRAVIAMLLVLVAVAILKPSGGQYSISALSISHWLVWYLNKLTFENPYQSLALPKILI